MKCPKCGGFTQFFQSKYLTCRDCSWVQLEEMAKKTMRDSAIMLAKERNKLCTKLY